MVSRQTMTRLNPHANNAPGVNNALFPGVIIARKVNNARPGVNTARPGVNTARPGVNIARPGPNNARPGVNNVHSFVNNTLIFFLPSNLLFKALGDLCQQNNLKTFKNFLYLE